MKSSMRPPAHGAAPVPSGAQGARSRPPQHRGDGSAADRASPPQRVDGRCADGRDRGVGRSWPPQSIGRKRRATRRLIPSCPIEPGSRPRRTQRRRALRPRSRQRRPTGPRCAGPMRCGRAGSSNSGASTRMRPARRRKADVSGGLGQGGARGPRDRPSNLTRERARVPAGCPRLRARPAIRVPRRGRRDRLRARRARRSHVSGQRRHAARRAPRAKAVDCQETPPVVRPAPRASANAGGWSVSP